MANDESVDTIVFSDDERELEENEIHVRKQNRRGRKWLTTVENIPDSCDMIELLNSLKKELSCNGSVVTEPTTGRKILQMQGDHGRKIQGRLVLLFPKHKVQFHGC